MDDRMQQNKVMLAAAKNHIPEVLVIDKVGNRDEAHAAASTAAKGITVIATAHGHGKRS